MFKVPSEGSCLRTRPFASHQMPAPSLGLLSWGALGCKSMKADIRGAAGRLAVLGDVSAPLECPAPLGALLVFLNRQLARPSPVLRKAVVFCSVVWEGGFRLYVVRDFYGDHVIVEQGKAERSWQSWRR